MSKKRRRDFSEKSLGKANKEIFSKSVSDNQIREREELQRSKLKHSDDYSNKRVEVSERYQDKVREQSHRGGRRSKEPSNARKQRRYKTQEELTQTTVESKETQFLNADLSDSTSRKVKDIRLIDGKSTPLENKSSSRKTKTSNNLHQREGPIGEVKVVDSNSNSKDKKARQRRQQAKFQKEEKSKLENQDSHQSPEDKSIQKETSSSGEIKNDYEVEPYDPLSKDMDNDGVIDRYDNDFRDSTVSYEEKDRKSIQQKAYKRNNYTLEFHRSKKSESSTSKMKEIKSVDLPNNLPNDKKIRKLQNKQSKELSRVQSTSGKIQKKKSLTLSTTGAMLEASKSYLRSGSQENTGVDASEKSLGASSKLVHGIKDYKAKRQDKRVKALGKYDDKILLRKSKLEFRDAKKVLQADESYQKMNAFKKFQKRKQMKATIYKKNNSGIKERIKIALKKAIKGTKEVIKKKAARLGIMLFGLFLFLSVILNSCSLFGGLSGGSSMITSSSYLTSDREITVSDELLQELETDLLVEIKNIPKDHPGYDSYQYQVDSVGHDPQVLIAYLTAKYGEYSFAEVESEINEIFKSMYKLKLEEKVETYTVIETIETEDPATGVITIEEVEVEKTRRILITILSSKRLEDVLNGRLNQEQQEHYEVLNETKGNFMNLHSPIQGDWKNKVSSMYGYRADPFTGEKKFHSGIDIADGAGTPLLAVFDGTVTYVEHSDSGYGNYVEIKDKEGNMARYAHASSITSSVGQVVKEGDEIAKMGTTGNSTGNHLHFELHLADGTRVNPYFYLYSEETFENYTKPSASSFNAFNWQGGDVQETVWGYLITNGYTPEAAAGIMGNIEAESGFNTSAVENSVTNPGEGIGLIQWSFGRKAQLISFAESQGKHWSDIGVQIAFLDYEMNGAEGTVFPGGANEFKQLTSIEEATSQFCWLFERPNAKYAHYDRRSNAAHGFYEMYKDFDSSVVTP